MGLKEYRGRGVGCVLGLGADLYPRIISPRWAPKPLKLSIVIDLESRGWWETAMKTWRVRRKSVSIVPWSLQAPFNKLRPPPPPPPPFEDSDALSTLEDQTHFSSIFRLFSTSSLESLQKILWTAGDESRPSGAIWTGCIQNSLWSHGGHMGGEWALPGSDSLLSAHCNFCYFWEREWLAQVH